MSSAAVVFEALDFAARRHSAQRRKGPGGAPYVNHLIEVVRLLAVVAGVQDAEVLAAGALHDVLEDTATTREELLELFGERVCNLVQSLTDDRTLPRERRRAIVLQHLPLAEEVVRLVKLADLTSNIAELPSDWDGERQRTYLDWSARAAALCFGQSKELDSLYQRRALSARAATAAAGTA
jgi:(p)ppGpp synthase/HD superfamily hydrolase